MFAALVLAFPLVAQTRAPETKTVAVPEVQFEKYTLPNGLDVILHIDRKLPIVHVNQWYHVGSKNEKKGRTGFAHLFEHMMFQGSKNVPGEYFTVAERAGANLREGGVNGTTDFDRTNYFATVPSGNLETLLWLESDRLATLTEAIDKEKLDNQRDVVRNERRQGLENQPYGRWIQLAFENMHPTDHPYSWLVIGSHEDLQAASIEDVTEFFKRYYTPNNLTLVIAGDFDPAEAKRLVEKYFGGIPAGPALDRHRQYMPKLDGEKIIEIADRVPQERTYFGWPSPAYFSADEAALELAATILADGLSSRLNKTLVYDKQIASNVNAFQFANEISGTFFVIATARPGASLHAVEEGVTAEIARLAKEGPTAEELSRAKTKWEYDFVTGLEGIGGFGGKADQLARYNTYLGDPGMFDEDVARFRAVTAADVKRAVGQYLDTRNRLLLRFHPEPSTRASDVALDRSKQPALGADRPFTAPTVQSAKLDNGMEILLVERGDIPKVSVDLVTRAGSIADPGGKEGVAHLTIATIDMGTKTRQALQIEDAMGNLGTSFRGFAAREYSSVGFEALERNVAAALDILADVARNPQFPQSEVERETKRHLDVLAQQANNPNIVANRTLPMLMYGRNHPYGRPLQGLPETINNITRADLASFHSTYWKPGSSALVFVGDISLEEAKALAAKTFGSWSGGAAPQVEVPAIQPAGQGKVFLIDRQDAAQTVVAQLLPGPARNAEDFYAFRVVDSVWGGGGFGTRLNLNLREEKGYSYGVFSNMANFRNFGSWWATGGVQTDKTKESLAEFVKELTELAGSRPISADELKGARETRTRGYSQQFENLGRISGQIASLWAAGLPMTELQREFDATAAMQMGAVQAATKKYVDPSKATLLLVGDLSKIEPGIRSLNLGEIVILDTDGRPVQRTAPASE